LIWIKGRMVAAGKVNLGAVGVNTPQWRINPRRARVKWVERRSPAVCIQHRNPLVAGFLVASLVGNRIARSIRGLVAPATALGSGDPVEIPTRYLRETNDVGEALLRASDLLQERTRLSHFDSLTGLANRPRLLEEIERQIKTAEEVRVVTDTLRAECAKPVRVAGREMAIGITMGVSFFPDDARDVHTLLRYADLAIYRAKVDGRNTVRFYSPELV
jgi:GGDEF domain-containing protein